MGRLTNSDKLIFHATFGNDGATDTIPTAIMLINDEMTRILARGDYEWAIVKKGEQVTMDYEYALDTIPQGQYKATVLYFDWNEEYWIYDSRFVYTITIVNNSAKGDVNMDNAVNGTDLVALSNIVLGRKEKTESADVNGDGSVNGTDIVALSNIILI